MKSDILVVDAAEFRNITGSRPFIALPQEEIDRLHASTELFTLPPEHTGHNSPVLQLMVLPIIHFNYSWATLQPINSSDGNNLSLGISDTIHSEHESILFLDEDINKEAEMIVRNRIHFNSGFTFRLAGILYDESTDFGRSHPAFVYVVRLHQPKSIMVTDDRFTLSWCGTGELQQRKDQYDIQSQIIIDHITAL